MARNPLRMGRKKPYALPKRPKPVVVEEPKPRLHAKAWDIVKGHPHLFLVSALFIFMFATDRINLVTFVSLGFFCLLFSDHMVETGRTYWQRRQEEKLRGQNPQGPERVTKLGYYQRLAKKQRDRV